MTNLQIESNDQEITNGETVKIIKINKERISKRIHEEANFISQLFLMTGIPSHGDDEDEEEDDGTVYLSDKKANQEDPKAVHRAKSFRELSDKLEKLKSTVDYSVKNKQAKKSLARRLKKKALAEEKRKLSKKKKKQQGNLLKKEKRENVKQETKDEVVKPKKPVFNSEGNIVFSKFDFSESSMAENKKRSDPKRILEGLQKQKEVIRGLRQAGDVEKASKIIEKTSWKNAFAKVEGEKVKDDPELLKKTIKKKEKQKQRSAKKWEQRLETVEKSKHDRQKKRETNLQKRKQDKKKKVMKTAVKRGRLIP